MQEKLAKLEGGKLYVLINDVHGENGAELIHQAQPLAHFIELWTTLDDDTHEVLNQELGPERALELMDKVYDARFREGLYKPRDYGTLYRMLIWDQFAGTQIARSWAEHLTTQSKSVGGDDSYYDYFPGAVDMLRELCVALQLYGGSTAEIAREVYNQTLIYLKTNPPYEGEEEEVFGDPIKEG